MRKTFLRVMYFVVLTTIICIGCGGDDGQTRSLLAGDLINAITGGRGTDTPVVLGPYTLTINPFPTEGGTVSRSPNASSYAHGTQVSVTAVATDGHRFTGWSGDVNDTSATVTITMSRDLTITANFIPINVQTYTLTVRLEPSVGGNVSREPNLTVYRDGEQVTVTADALPGYTFTGWSGDANGANAAVTVTMNRDLTITANFQQQTYSLSTGANPASGGTVSRDPQKSAYTYGERVTVTATPADGYSFRGWENNAAPADRIVTVTMDSNKTLTAIFEQNTYRLTTNVSPNGYGSILRNPNKETYTYGEQVTVTATPATASGDNYYAFNGWTGALESNSNVVTITMDNDKALTANFIGGTVPYYTLATTTNPSDIGAAISRNPNNASYRENQTVTVTAPTVNGYTFTGWSGDATGTTNPLTVTVKEDMTLMANYRQLDYTLNVARYPTNGGSVSPNTNTYTYNQTATITATSANCYKFIGWSGDTSGMTNPIMIKMNSNKSLTANFELRTYTLEVGKNINGGEVISNPNKDAYTCGEQVTVTARAADGYTFTGWSGALTSQEATVTITMDGDKQLKANFKQDQYTLTTSVSSSGSGTISRTPTSTDQTKYTWGTTVTVTATPSGCYTFTGWSGTGAPTPASTNPVTITMDGNKTLVANFQQTYMLTTNVSPTGGGTVSRSLNQTCYNPGTNVTVTAEPASGYVFTRWSGASTSTNASVTVDMNSNLELTANFQQVYILKTNVSPGGSGTVSRSPDQAYYTPGTSVTLEANPIDGYEFTGWSSGASISRTSKSVMVTMTSDWELTANFHRIYTLITNMSPVDGGTVSRSPNQTSYMSGSSVTVTAEPASGYVFTRWSGASTSTSTSVTVAMNSNLELTANFEHALTINQIGQGIVSRSPDQTSYSHGTSVTITATPTNGYFIGWSGASSSKSTSITITMDGNKTLTASFRTYKTVRIGNQTWMAENADYQPPTGNSWCYDNRADNCDKYGRLYDWNTARASCPSGWHLPSRPEWNTLVTTAGAVAGTTLKARSGWNQNGNGTDDYGFSALPGGYRDPNGSFNHVGLWGNWWTNTDSDANTAHIRLIYRDDGGVRDGDRNKGFGYSVRCLQD
ncbi:MAG: InlB B-repeat-containing protein [Chitinispirillales bacterium]|jgi:uncharacterized protein (TIGR02145 family)/uncharacterized repeat protein (TIGR02543 family)|nr:InlB B-repeat-containing protein [Chitinispirillales bacterium]